MATQRLTIRSQMVTTLAAVSGWSLVVSSGQYDAVPEVDLKDGPQVRVFALRESVEPITSHPRRLRRGLEVIVEVYRRAAPGANLEELLDADCEKVENAVEDDNTLSGTVTEITLETTEYDVTADGNDAFGVATMSFEAIYDIVEGT